MSECIICPTHHFKYYGLKYLGQALISRAYAYLSACGAASSSSKIRAVYAYKLSMFNALFPDSRPLTSALSKAAPGSYFPRTRRCHTWSLVSCRQDNQATKAHNIYFFRNIQIPANIFLIKQAYPDRAEAKSNSISFSTAALHLPVLVFQGRFTVLEQIAITTGELYICVVFRSSKLYSSVTTNPKPACWAEGAAIPASKSFTSFSTSLSSSVCCAAHKWHQIYCP